MSITGLLSDLEKVIRFYKSPDCDFGWSHYSSANEAIDEMTGIVTALKDGKRREVLDKVKLLFGPTGDVGEIAISSGWSEEYLAIAERVDAAIAELRPIDRE